MIVIVMTKRTPNILRSRHVNGLKCNYCILNATWLILKTLPFWNCTKFHMYVIIYDQFHTWDHFILYCFIDCDDYYCDPNFLLKVILSKLMLLTMQLRVSNRAIQIVMLEGSHGHLWYKKSNRQYDTPFSMLRPEDDIFRLMTHAYIYIYMYVYL